jgi:hypothetical protein
MGNKKTCRYGENVLVAESWMIDELAYAGPEHLDAAFVAGFDRKQGYPDPAEDLDALAAQGVDADATSEDYAEHIRTEHSTFRWLLEPMLAATGFETIAAQFQGRLYGAYTCVKR